MEISQFTKDIRHIKGVKNIAGDYFSRIPPPEGDKFSKIPPPEVRGSVYQNLPKEIQKPLVASMQGHKLEALSPAVLAESQEDCDEIKQIKKGIFPPSTSFQDIQFGHSTIFCEISGAQPRPYLPKKLRLFVQKQLHFDHKGQKEAVKRLSSHYYWNNIRMTPSNS